jgi:hypothetical protein
MKRETILAHRRICLDNDPRAAIDEAGVMKVAAAEPVGVTEQQRDFASVVQQRALDLLEKGELRVTATHGLQAQALIDRRVEKAADRDLAVNIARLLSGAMVPVPQTVIDVTPYEAAQLAPPELVEP